MPRWQWESKVERSQEEFERISRSIKKEMEMFDCNRVKDFKACIVKYLETLMTNQQKVTALHLLGLMSGNLNGF